MTKQANKKPKGKAGKQPKPFIDQVLAALGKKPQSSGDIAKKLKLVDAEGNATNYGKSKVRTFVKQLIDAGKAEQDGAYKTAKYKRAA